MATTATRTSTFLNFIDGEWQPSVSGDLFENRNPANTDDLIGQTSRKESLARDMTREMGKVLEEARGGVQEAVDMMFKARSRGAARRSRAAGPTRCSFRRVNRL